jgi:hypothetical protein
MSASLSCRRAALARGDLRDGLLGRGPVGPLLLRGLLLRRQLGADHGVVQDLGEAGVSEADQFLAAQAARLRVGPDLRSIGIPGRNVPSYGEMRFLQALGVGGDPVGRGPLCLLSALGVILTDSVGERVPMILPLLELHEFLLRAGRIVTPQRRPVELLVARDLLVGVDQLADERGPLQVRRELLVALR